MFWLLYEHRPRKPKRTTVEPQLSGHLLNGHPPY